MRFLGLVFIIAVVLLAVGFFRGWFSVSAVHAGGKSDITLGVDGNKIGDDANAVAARMGQLSASAVEKVKSMSRTVGADESELEGTLTSVDPTARDLTLTVNSQPIEMHVPSGIPITREGQSVGFDELRSSLLVKCFFKHAGDDRKLSRIEIQK